ncbi:MAG TPA: VOC family protein [Polyangia bacterium]|nr:VOC family protein [Polyangia bacterium]
MAKLFVNIDVPEIERGVAFYTSAFGLRVGRRFGPTVVELAGAPVPIYLLEKPATTAPFAGAVTARDYARHWTPVHFDYAVEELDPALARAVAAGAQAESEILTYPWGRIVYLADPFGHGFCLLQLDAAGYEALATPSAPAETGRRPSG